MVYGISLFSGAGGLDVGAENAGLDIIACIENDPDSVQTLGLNSRCSKDSIFEESVSGFDYTRILERLPEKGVAPRVVIGGPPCQPFSKNGYWVKNDNRKVDADPRNLVSEFLTCVEKCEVDGFMLENVESLLHPTNKHVCEYIIDRANASGYATQLVRANAADFGVPQKRKRVFIFGFKGDRRPDFEPMPTHCAPNKRDLFDDLPPHLGVGPFIEKYSGKKFAETSEDASEGNYFYELQHVPPGKNYIHLASLNGFGGRSFRSGSRFWNFLLKLHPELPSWTIAAQPGPWVGPFHWSDRRLRVPEIAAIQTFPKGYMFFGKRRSVQKQIGNAVPVKLAKHMVRHLLENL